MNVKNFRTIELWRSESFVSLKILAFRLVVYGGIYGQKYRNEKVHMATVAPGQLTFLVESKLSLPKLEVILTLATQSKSSLSQL